MTAKPALPRARDFFKGKTIMGKTIKNANENYFVVHHFVFWVVPPRQDPRWAFCYYNRHSH